MSRHKKKNKKNGSIQAAEEIKTAAVSAEAEAAEESSSEETPSEELEASENVESVTEETEAEGENATEETIAEEASGEEAEEPAEPASEESAAEEISEETEVKSEEEKAIEEAVSEDEADKAAEEASEEDKSKTEKSPSKEKKVSRDALREQTENERIRREARHRKRIRQQVTAYLILIVILAVIGGGLFFGIKFFVDGARDRRAQQEAAELAAQQQLEEQAQQQAEPVVEETPAPTVEDLGPTPMEQLDALIAADIANMTLEEKIQGLMFITPESITGVDRVMIAGEGTAAALSDFCPGGIVYSAKNVTSADQFSEMMATTTTLVNRPVFLATSETGLNESGLVGTGVITSSMTPAEAAATGDVEQVVNVGINVGTGLHSVGITVNFAPVADLSVTAGGIGVNASYGDDAAVVTPYVTAMADGLSQAGVTSVYRYFPSLAASAQNPQYGRAVSDRNIEDFRNNEFQVWLSAINAGASMIQMSNVIYPSIDSDSLPSSLSDKTVTGVLRDELRYEGVIISGPLNDAAITSYYTAPDAAVMALKAGCDMLYASPDPRAAVAGIMDAVSEGVISEQRIDDALVRIYRVRYADELERLRGEYEASAVTMGVDLTGVQY